MHPSPFMRAHTRTHCIGLETRIVWPGSPALLALTGPWTLARPGAQLLVAEAVRILALGK